MAGISAPGVGSGLDINSLVSQLVAAERSPQQTSIDKQRSTATTQVSALGALKSSLSLLRDALASLSSGTAFGARTAVSSDTAIFSATAGGSSAGGSYNIEVVQLAQAQKAASTAYGSSTAVVGNGTLSIAVGTSTMNLEIGPGNNTLAGIRDAINRASDNPGVTATIVSGSDGARLVLTSKATGEANAFMLSSIGGADGGLDALVSGMGNITDAKNAIIKVDGFEATSASNTVSNAIDGVTLNLAAAKPGETRTLTINLDRSAVKASLDSFVNAYNNFLALSKQLSAYDAATGKKGALLGDATLRAVSSGLSRTLGARYGDADSGLSSLSDLGISVQLDGKLALDADKLNSALDSGTDKISALFTGNAGIASTLTTQLDGWLDTGGVFEARTKGLTQRTKQLDASQELLDVRMTSVEARYRAQFTALDKLLANLNSTSAFLTQQLASLNKSSD
jgi:flagellar hook-associated protein 2